jgi:hypothetical protein
MSPAPSERRPAPRPFTLSRFLDRSRKPAEDVDTLFRLAQLCILKYDLEQKALPSYLRLPGLGPDGLCGHPSGLPTRQQRTPHLQAGLGQKRCRGRCP